MISTAHGGEGGIRTPGTLASTPHFECGAINHSATSPEAASPSVTASALQDFCCASRQVSCGIGRNRQGAPCEIRKALLQDTRDLHGAYAADAYRTGEMAPVPPSNRHPPSMTVSRPSQSPRPQWSETRRIVVK